MLPAPTLDRLLELVPEPREHAPGTWQVLRRRGAWTAGVEALEEAVAADDPDRVLRDGLRGDRRLGSHDRRVLGEALYAVVRHRRLLERALSEDGWTGDVATLLGAGLVIVGGASPAEATSALGAPCLAKLPGLRTRVAGWLAHQDLAVALAWTASLSDDFARLLAAEPDPVGLCAGLAGRAPLTGRVNLLRSTVPDVVKELEQAGVEARQGRWCHTALHLPQGTPVRGLQVFRQGRLELQDEGSQLVAALVGPEPDGLVVDLCAGAGGKTLAIGAARGSGRGLVALDVRGAALAEAEARASRAGLYGVTFRAFDGVRAPLGDGVASRVLVDAPCSGTGTLRRRPGLRAHVTDWGVVALQSVQEALLDEAVRLVKPGGRVVYATCSVLGPENERVVQVIERRHPGLRRVPVAELLDSPVTGGSPFAAANGALVLRPDLHGTDGFFAAVLQKGHGPR